MNDLQTIARKLAVAKCPEDVFDVDLLRDPQHQVAVQYRRMQVIVHPDRHHHGSDHAVAEVAFRRLEELHEQALRKISGGTYGDRRAAASPPVRETIEVRFIKTSKAEYTVGAAIGHGDLATIYEATSTAFAGAELALKLADHPGDNDLLEREARVLGILYPRPTTTPPDGGLRFISPLLDTFVLRGGRTQRRVNVTGRAVGHVSLTEVLAAYPKGLDFRDVVWIFKRTLYALWFIHREGVVHGAVLPPHVMVHPTGHGAKLVDWCYAVPQWKEGREHVRAISKPLRAYYAPEILAKDPPSPATDIYMAARCAVALLGGNVETSAMPKSVPTQIQAFLQSCLIAAPSRRPNDAGALHEEFDELLLRLVGKPTYRPLAMPGK